VAADDPNSLRLFDFGISAPVIVTREPLVRDPESGNRYAVGTLSWASVNAHAGIGTVRSHPRAVAALPTILLPELAPRDDLESLAYMLLYLLRGNFPWTHVSHRDWGTMRAATVQTHELKLSVAGEQMASGHPPEFGHFLDDVRALSFDASPDYDGYRRRFQDVRERCGVSDESRVLDWTPLPKPDVEIGILIESIVYSHC
jgi:hypothetical protein